MLKAKPYHGLQPHLEDAYRVFQALWRREEEMIRTWCRRHLQDVNQIYHILRLGVFAHDIGKANETWQEYLHSGKKHTSISHPLLSFAALWELLKQWEDRSFLEDPLYRTLLTSVLAHHHMLHDNSYQHVRRLAPMSLPADETNALFSAFFAKEPLPFGPWIPFTQERLTWTGPELADRVAAIRDWITQFLSNQEKRKEKILHTFFLSILCLCDNASSAVSSLYQTELVEAEPAVTEGRLQALSPDWLPHFSFQAINNPIFCNPNRLQAMLLEKIDPYMILRAGCGEGKTGAALLFARHWMAQDEADRMIFTLPTRFTSNSMYQDFIAPSGYQLPQEAVGLYHSEAEQVLAALEGDSRDHIEDAVHRSLEDRLFFNHFYHLPVTISTVDHLLYSLLHAHKYSDRAFGNIQRSVVIFDELHYYEPFTLKKIAVCLRLLRHMRVPHLLMSATLPQSFLDRINPENRRGKRPYRIVQSDGRSRDGQRAKEPFAIQKGTQPLYDRERGLSPEAEQIISEHLHIRQMIVVNQVERAKNIAKELIEKYPAHNIICYHSEFRSVDRHRKEAAIKALFKPAMKRSEEDRVMLRELGYSDSDAVILVTTQICEMSLDISCDLQLTDLAPIDALAQRGGRLHRKGEAVSRAECGCPTCREHPDLTDDFVYKQIVFPLDWSHPYAGLPYVDEKVWGKDTSNLLSRSWNILGDVHSFLKVTQWVNQVYESFPQMTDLDMERYILQDAVFGKRPVDRFGPDEHAEESEGSFQARRSSYRTVDVIPSKYLSEIMSRIDFKDPSYLSSKERKNLFRLLRDYIIPMKIHRFYQALHNNRVNVVEPAQGVRMLFVDIPYFPERIGFDYTEPSSEDISGPMMA